MDIGNFVSEMEKQQKEQDSIYHNAAVKFGLSDTAMWILYVISRTNKEYFQHELCDMSFFAKQTINSAISGLVKKGYIELKTDEKSRRQKKVVLTENGKLFAASTTKKLYKAEERAYKNFSDEEMEFYLDITKRINKYLKEEIFDCQTDI